MNHTKILFKFQDIFAIVSSKIHAAASG